jgi:hypothetical protein
MIHLGWWRLRRSRGQGALVQDGHAERSTFGREPTPHPSAAWRCLMRPSEYPGELRRRGSPLTLISARGGRIRGELVDVSIRRAEVLPRIAIGHDAQLAEQLNVGCARELVSRGLDVVD